MMEPGVLVIPSFVSVTMGLLVYLIGVRLTAQSASLRDFNIPEPVSGGILVSIITMLAFYLLGVAVEFTLDARDYLLVLFFATIGMNARLSDLGKGGKPLALLLVLTILFILLQNVVGQIGATVFGLPGAASVFLGSAALIGGHGTVIAWAPEVTAASGVAGASELGIAMATLGLVIAALIGGPIAKYLIARDGLTPEDPKADDVLGLPFDEAETPQITSVALMQVLLYLHLAMIFGYLLNEALEQLGVDLPLFVSCMLVAIMIGNLRHALLRERDTVQHSPSLSLVGEFALGVFLAMSLMSLQLWTLQGLGLTLAVTLAAQTLLTVGFCILVVYRVMGRTYFACVLSAGFGGFGLGATPTAIANMTAVTKRYGPSPLAFIVLPLISAFFVDIANSFIIGRFIGF